jgi:hypothetical protein
MGPESGFVVDKAEERDITCAPIRPREQRDDVPLSVHPSAIGVSVSVLTRLATTLHSTLLQKCDGRFYIALWQEVSV